MYLIPKLEKIAFGIANLSKAPKELEAESVQWPVMLRLTLDACSSMVIINARLRHCSHLSFLWNASK
jgi:hypothetical protein